MPSRAAAIFGMKVVLMKLMLSGIQVDSAPAERRGEMAELTGFGRGLDPPLGGSTDPSSFLLNPSQHIKTTWPDRATGNAERMTPKSITVGIMEGESQIRTDVARPDSRAKIARMISALAELHRTFNSTLSSHITFLPRGNSRNPKRKPKVPPAADKGAKTTPAPPPVSETTTAGASPDSDTPGLSGRNLRKPLPPQSKKTNKRVCFWKYCSQN
ncbi:urotensin II-related peptide isoform X1 [Cyprinodon tularosa]|uniref:urotensin II-related peptide isoform X1 n=1 Tax=Cyprinodon tularosa TaxID=77115 RepID=UPI0018E1DCAB|nr:urotensin II-related peptide isoform X1 [Cyprinodon tularosa]